MLPLPTEMALAPMAVALVPSALAFAPAASGSPPRHSAKPPSPPPPPPCRRRAGVRHVVPGRLVVGELHRERRGEERPDLRGLEGHVLHGHGLRALGRVPAVADDDLELHEKAGRGAARLVAGKLAAEHGALPDAERVLELDRVRFPERDADLVAGHLDSFAHVDLRRGCRIPVVRDGEVPRRVGVEAGKRGAVLREEPDDQVGMHPARDGRRRRDLLVARGHEDALDAPGADVHFDALHGFRCLGTGRMG